MIANSISRVGLIARNTFLEAVRQKFFNVLVILAVALIGSSNFFRQFDFGTSELKFISDFGLGAIMLFGSILAIVASAQLFFSEVENRTALTMLAKPIQRWEFVFGKFAGIFFLLFLFTALMILLLAGMLSWRESELLAHTAADDRLISLGGLLMFGFIQWIQFGVLAAITLFIASFSNTNLYTVIVGFFVMLICQLQYVARDSWGDIANVVLRTMVLMLSLLFPNFQLFNVAENLIYPDIEALAWYSLAGIAGYGLVYIIVFNALAVVSFKSREF